MQSCVIMPALWILSQLAVIGCQSEEVECAEIAICGKGHNQEREGGVKIWVKTRRPESECVFFHVLFES